MPKATAIHTFHSYTLVLLELPNGAPLELLWYEGGGFERSLALVRFLGTPLRWLEAGVA